METHTLIKQEIDNKTSERMGCTKSFPNDIVQNGYEKFSNTKNVTNQDFEMNNNPVFNNGNVQCTFINYDYCQQPNFTNNLNTYGFNVKKIFHDNTLTGRIYPYLAIKIYKNCFNYEGEQQEFENSLQNISCNQTNKNIKVKIGTMNHDNAYYIFILFDVYNYNDRFVFNDNVFDLKKYLAVNDINKENNTLPQTNKEKLFGTFKNNIQAKLKINFEEKKQEEMMEFVQEEINKLYSELKELIPSEEFFNTKFDRLENLYKKKTCYTKLKKIFDR
jgi:hypothetical protein